MIGIKKIRKFMIFIFLIFSVLLVNIIIVQTKEKVLKNYINKQMYTGEFIDANKNLRTHYLKYYIEDSISINNEKREWHLKITTINLDAIVAEGTSNEILNKYIGHFEETKFLYGNVGLAAHNRGYPVNYFKDLDKVKIGDYIDYVVENFSAKYKINSIAVIKDTDWSYLKETKEEKLTLITCVKNQPEYRLCVQAYKESEDVLNNAKKDFNSRHGNNFIIKCDINRKC